MKNKLALFTFILSASIALAASVGKHVLETKSKASVVTSITVGRVQGDAAADGSILLTVIPRITKTDSEGEIIVTEFAPSNEWLQVPISKEQLAEIHDAVKAAYVAHAGK